MVANRAMRRDARIFLMGFGLASIVGASAVGCFDDPGTSECTVGASGCECFSNQTCDVGLVCSAGVCSGAGETGDGDGDMTGDGDGDMTGDGDGDTTGDGDGDMTGDGDGDGEMTGDGDGDSELFPVAPDGGYFEWQSRQVRFRNDLGEVCEGHVTMGMGDQVFCYVGSDNEMYCAGRLFETVYGNEFQPTTLPGVEQILIRPTFNSENGNGACILRNQRVYCMGANNNSGQYGTGGTSSLATWTQWGNVASLVAVATATGDSFCALQDDGDVFCAGSGHGNLPILVDSGVEKFYMNTFGQVVIDDADVWRVSPVRATCQLRGSGLVCGGQSYGPPGDIVDGGNVGDAVCWLTKAKSVSCTGNNKNDYFEAGRVLALATGSVYSTSMCAAYDDGSLWCIGNNTQGMLGTGNNLPVNVETMVAGPGSVRIGCP
jgi:hypothetical protein